MILNLKLLRASYTKEWIISNENIMWAGIQCKITTANRAYVAHTKLFGSRALSRNTKLKLCKPLTRPIQNYRSDAWAKTSDETNALRIFERKRIWKTYRRFIVMYIRTHKEIMAILQAGRYCKMHKIRPTKTVWSCWKNAKPENDKTNCNRYNWRNKEKKRTT